MTYQELQTRNEGLQRLLDASMDKQFQLEEEVEKLRRKIDATDRLLQAIKSGRLSINEL